MIRTHTHNTDREQRRLFDLTDGAARVHEGSTRRGLGAGGCAA
ncbi:hypothetical protein FBPa18_0022 [Pseudomonas phage vB_PaeP_FBPa18]|nr:hypothetical protein FBPa18_0022 [Pseudomonas phage vB_PaeP_FBPa18]